MIKALTLEKTWSLTERNSFPYAYIHPLHKGLIPSVLAPYTWIYSQTTYAKQDRTNPAGGEGGGLWEEGPIPDSCASLKPHKYRKRVEGADGDIAIGRGGNIRVSGLTCTLKEKENTFE